MNKTLVWQLAFRYLRGKRSGNAVPILSRISMVAIGVASCAMIILFSVFNGFTHLVRDLYKSFYPEIKITAARGKFFAPPADAYNIITGMKGVAAYAHVLEDNVLVTSEEDQRVATIKGIDKAYFKVNNLKPHIIQGRDSVISVPEATGIFGAQLLIDLGLDVENAFSSVMLYYPNAETDNMVLNPTNAFQSVRVRADGAFRVQEDFDDKYILADMPVVQSLFNAPGKYSSIELSLEQGADADDVKKELQGKLGNTYKVETRYEQNKTLYMVMRSEKWAIFAILLMVLLIASFNMVGALSLLVMEKQKDMAILKAMGAEGATVRNIFMAEGILWSLVGGVTGLVLGILICLGQQQFQWIKMRGSWIIEAYPVRLQPMDALLIIVTVVLVGLLASWYPALRAVKTEASLRSN